DRVALDEDRRRAAQTKADTEYLARELAALRLAVGEVATRDYLRRELEELRERLTEHLQLPQPPDGKDAASRQDGSDGWAEPAVAIAATAESRLGMVIWFTSHRTPRTVECT